MRAPLYRSRKSQQGLAMVEFAIALPLLLLLLLTVGELGRLLLQYNTLVQASRDSSRYLSAHAWNRTLGQLDLNAELTGQTRNLALYGWPAASPGSRGSTAGRSRLPRWAASTCA